MIEWFIVRGTVRSIVDDVPVSDAWVVLRWIVDGTSVGENRSPSLDVSDANGRYRVSYSHHLSRPPCDRLDAFHLGLAGIGDYLLVATDTIPCDFTRPDSVSVDLYVVPRFEVEVTAMTTGRNPDLDGYDVLVQDFFGRKAVGIGINETLLIYFGQRSTQFEHQVELLDVASNCQVIGDNPRTFLTSVTGVGATHFEVICS